MTDSQDSIIQKSKLPNSPEIKLHERSLSRTMILVVFVSLLLITGYTLTHLDTAGVQINQALKELMTTLNQMFLQPNAGTDGLPLLMEALGNSVLLSILTTIIGAVFGFLFAVLASKNLTNAYLGAGIRVIMAVIRAIPTIIWALIFSIVCGLGTTAAILGLSFHSIAYLTKAYSESIEGIDNAKIESLKVTGAKFWVIVFQAIWPTIVASFVSWTFIRLEINFANAIAVGAAAGAGGIGYQLFVASGMSFDFHETGLIVYLVILVTFVLEFIAVKIRQYYLNR
ncbi:phosphonate ABC transporter permease [Companilactobacillus crustorum]|uniref:Binding-protein-dependent transport systems inner membrane component n=3 Tax=Companilactobacillus TaxID=2767879 RepID=A0A837RJH7_9LACO|nr:ABC transporter permease subunit [Companilactobacillus crustorum]HCD06884.1 ABC transporter permease [Lactobacillus sp.]KRK44165.1 binding-protein-dependent transport systems inner membrane component [Companilactobacillus crustorum JCM 15951]KRO21540.1 binding-protein-dependent transport systems inner membrane component [Companilactobacillus crustorum]WDT64973.1 ABC transporter permease subunit [Companilactobacillus crustorum]GEO75703.1 phosphonate ABC transporter permease [Companilactobaci